MLIEVSVANFRSFRDRVTLSLEAEPRISERDKSVDERNVAHTADGDLLRVVGIYGANASGKSNLVTALSTLRSLALNSAREGQMGDRLPAAPFRLDAESLAAASELEVVFTQDGAQVRYGVAFTAKRVEREWLFVRPLGEAEEQRWFERTHDTYEVGGVWVRDVGIEKKTRTEALHLSVAAAWNHAQAQRLLEWFTTSLYVLDASSDKFGMTVGMFQDPIQKNAIQALMRRLDLGIDDIERVPYDVQNALTGTMSVQNRFVAIRRGIHFDLQNDESAGTAKAVALSGPFIKVLAVGGVLVIDEFDARLHTLLAKQLVELFQDPLTNPHDAQLVFTSHDTNLLTRTLLRRDQLWFVEKSHKTHASDLYSLAEFRLEDGKAVRNDARYETDYLQGKYGAIPFFGNLKAILGEALARKG
jgi:hypothetical protein